MTELPRGLGAFLASGDVQRVRDPEMLGREAEMMLATRIRWTLLLVRSFDARRPLDLETAVRIADQLRARGIEVATWSFPAPADGAIAGRELGRVSRAIRAPLALFDAEDPDGRGPLDWEPPQARAMLDGIVDEIDEHTMPGVTSYPGRRGFGLPWNEFAWGVGVPQIYGTADSPRAAHDALERYRAVHGIVIPATSIRTPGKPDDRPTPERVVRRLDAVAIDPRTSMLAVRAIALWSWTLLRKSAAHRLAVAAWARKHGW